MSPFRYHQNMPDDFRFDVFQSQIAKDKPVVRELAARLMRDGIIGQRGASMGTPAAPLAW